MLLGARVRVAHAVRELADAVFAHQHVPSERHEVEPAVGAARETPRNGLAEREAQRGRRDIEAFSLHLIESVYTPRTKQLLYRSRACPRLNETSSKGVMLLWVRVFNH
jgi:hypothetical protein